MKNQSSVRIVKKILFLFFVSVFLFYSCLFVISGQPPELHVVQGFAYQSNGVTQVPSTTAITINATTTGSFLRTATFGPPGNTGFYASEINGEDGETVIVTAFNATRYGRNFSILSDAPATTRVNVVLNTTRPAEVNTTITFPTNNSYHDRFDVFNISFFVSAIGGQNSLQCNTTLVIGNQQILNVSNGGPFNKSLGDITLENSVSSFFELEGKFGGSTTVTIVSRCASDGENFDKVSSASIVVFIAQQAPSLHAVQGYIFLADNVTQAPSGTTVRLSASTTNSTVVLQTFGPPGHSGFYSGIINARDGELVTVRAENATHFGERGVYLLASPSITRINVSISETLTFPPYFSEIIVDDGIFSPLNEIDLVAADTRLVNCLGNVSDSDGYTDISIVTGIFYDSSEANLSSPNDNNNHYASSSCVLNDCAGLSCSVNCSFSVAYYANSNLNNAWLCVLNGTDIAGTSGFGNDSVSINQMLAIEFPDYLNYGVVGPGEVSNETNGTVINRGNVPISISIEGYGSAEDDGYAMVCDDGKNVAVGFEKYNLTSSNAGPLTLNSFQNLYKNVTSEPVNETTFVVDYRRNDTVNEAFDATFWRFYLPPGSPPGTSCTGFVNIGAI